MADDLRRYLNGEPILARPVSWIQRTWRWCRRNPRIAVPSAAAGVSVCLTAIIASWAWAATSAQAKLIADEKQKVEVQRDEADRQRAIANQQQKLAEERGTRPQTSRARTPEYPVRAHANRHSPQTASRDE
ncbi:MAG UNVERIFIED_CONTAM: hypothetical protein LVR18_43305 [Planctomycetaceae bacterium]